MNSYKFIVFASMIGCTLAAMAIGPAQVDPSQPDKCFDADTNKFYAPGETWQLEYCGISTCSLRNISGTPQLTVEYASCGIAMVDPPCYMKEDKTKQYPDCCPQPECPEDYSNEQPESDHEQRDAQEDYDFLNEIEDDEQGDSAFNHKYNHKIVDEDSVKDHQEDEEQVFYRHVASALPKNVNHAADADDSNFGKDQFTVPAEIEPAFQNAAYLKALQDELLRYYPNLRRASPRFGYLDSGEFKDEYFQWF